MSLDLSKNVLEEKRKNGQSKNLHKKTNTFTIIATDFVQEQLITPLAKYFVDAKHWKKPSSLLVLELLYSTSLYFC